MAELRMQPLVSGRNGPPDITASAAPLVGDRNKRLALGAVAFVVLIGVVVGGVLLFTGGNTGGDGGGGGGGVSISVPDWEDGATFAYSVSTWTGPTRTKTSQLVRVINVGKDAAKHQ